ncbi:hypothetical protein [Kitasatospora sp. LaBMicrA B282]|uniref:hypothetical protein n=1 Tax=Kitasatospora sp. LaBMicrA B282 TaxID=3420949 RepID=UPI003D110B08
MSSWCSEMGDQGVDPMAEWDGSRRRFLLAAGVGVLLGVPLLAGCKKSDSDNGPDGVDGGGGGAGGSGGGEGGGGDGGGEGGEGGGGD